MFTDGDALDNDIFIGRNAAGQLFVNGGAVPILGGTPTVANTGLIQLFGHGGNDTTWTASSLSSCASGGADDMSIGNLSGTDVTEIDIDLRGANGGSDGEIDAVTVNATNNADTFGITGDAGGVRVFGLQAEVDIFHTDADDRLTVNGLGGDDVIDATSLEAGAVQLTMNGGLGDDILIGSEGDDLFNGGDGNDLALMGAGDDTFVWNPGDDNDTIEGQAGFDTLQFNGSNVSENVTLSANGEGALFFRNVANVTMDLDGVEALRFDARGGADTIVIDDMSGTDVTNVVIDLGIDGAGDAQPDTTIINATNDDDVVLVTRRWHHFGVGPRHPIRHLQLRGCQRPDRHQHPRW